MNAIARLMWALMLTLVTSVGAFAQTIVAYDTLTNQDLWKSTTPGIVNYEAASFEGNVVAPFEGHTGYRVKKVGIITSFVDGGGQTVNSPASDWKLVFKFWTGWSDFVADPFRDNPPQGEYLHEFTTSELNSDWATPVWNNGGVNLFRLEVDVQSLNVMTFDGQVHGIALPSIGPNGGSTHKTLARFATGGVILPVGSSWYQSSSMGPGTLDSLGAPWDFHAQYIELEAVPEPNSLIALGIGGLAFLRRRLKKV